ncbi:Gfo/Idh/MocA family protein [Cohnella yongneupensis]|uniref:Gfo/Idh/MocA family protein n=1 Tax=Cohnella yongneupensis TaxID=425006 RepID=A0ABW0QZ39_9BACL
MMASNANRIGLIGLGDMANAHINGFKNHAPHMNITAICDVREAALAKTGDQLHIPESLRFADYRELIANDEVDTVISITPNALHAEIMELCLQAGKPFLSEKPFAMTMEEADRLLALYKDTPVPAMIGFGYRYTPAFRFARKLLSEGKIGNVRHFSVQYLQEWGSAAFDVPFVWRFDKKATGTGTLGDLGTHMIDLAHYLFGSFEELAARLVTLIEERKSLATGEPVQVEVDDLACFHALMKNGAVGTFQTTRNAIGSGNQLDISIYGDAGTIRASTEDPEHVVWIHQDGETGSRVEKRLSVPHSVKLSQWEDFARLLAGSPSDGLPGFMAGYESQQVLEAIVRSHEQKRTVTVGEEGADKQ